MIDCIPHPIADSRFSHLILDPGNADRKNLRIRRQTHHSVRVSWTVPMSGNERRHPSSVITCAAVISAPPIDEALPRKYVSLQVWMTSVDGIIDYGDCDALTRGLLPHARGVKGPQRPLRVPDLICHSGRSGTEEQRSRHHNTTHHTQHPREGHSVKPFPDELGRIRNHRTAGPKSLSSMSRRTYAPIPLRWLRHPQAPRLEDFSLTNATRVQTRRLPRPQRPGG